MRLEGWHIVVMIVLAIVLFGAPKLPGMARSVGQSLRIFRSEIRQLKDDDAPAGDAPSGPTGTGGSPGGTGGGPGGFADSGGGPVGSTGSPGSPGSPGAPRTSNPETRWASGTSNP